MISKNYKFEKKWRKRKVKEYSKGIIRKMALNGYVIIPKWPDLDQVISLHSRISNNLNQYARKANETGRPNKLYLKKMFWEIAIP